MNELKKGDKVFLKRDCFEMPEWSTMNRPDRKLFSAMVGCIFTVHDQCYAFTDRIHTESGRCIPSALLELLKPAEPVEAVKPEPVKTETVQYVFDRSLHAKEFGFTVWANEADGMPVYFEPGDNFGKCGKYGIHKSWCREVEQEKPVKPQDAIMIDIGPTVRAAARAASDMVDAFANAFKIHQSVKPITPTLHSYTPEQIAEARDIVYRLMTGTNSVNAVKVHCLQTPCWYDDADHRNQGKDHTVAIKLHAVSDHRSAEWTETDRAVAYCQPNDVWSDDVGRMVALCKLLREKLPEWVRGGAK